MSALLIFFFGNFLSPKSLQSQESKKHQDYTRTSLEGVYQGELITQTGIIIPIQLTLALGENLESIGADQLWDKLLPLSSSLVIDEEGGPYNFQQVSFDPTDGNIEFRYYRAGQAGQPNFRLAGKLVSPRQMLLEAHSLARGRLGQVVLKQTSTTPTPLEVKPKYIGLYRGIWTFYPEGRKERLTIHLAPSGVLFTNPETYEFDFSIGRTGSLNIGVEFPFQKIFFDYFTQKFTFVHVGVESRTVTLSGTFTEKGLKGEGDSSLRGKTGTFEATKESL